jgi:hypothetical protein
MPKELTFEQVEGNRGTVELDQRLAAARTGVMDRASDEFLSRPCFSPYEYSGIYWRYALSLLQDSYQSWAAAYDPLESTSPTIFISPYNRL